MDPLLDEFCAEVGLTPLAHAEYTLATGCANAVFNHLVIEYKRPGVLNKTPVARLMVAKAGGLWTMPTISEWRG